MSIASELDGKRYEVGRGTEGKEHTYNVQTMVYTFEDSSKAKLITKFEECEPFQNGIVTSSKRAFREWKEIKDETI